jgi:hypothetical protein
MRFGLPIITRVIAVKQQGQNRYHISWNNGCEILTIEKADECLRELEQVIRDVVNARKDMLRNGEYY